MARAYSPRRTVGTSQVSSATTRNVPAGGPFGRHVTVGRVVSPMITDRAAVAVRVWKHDRAGEVHGERPRIILIEDADAPRDHGVHRESAPREVDGAGDVLTGVRIGLLREAAVHDGGFVEEERVLGDRDLEH